MGLFTYMFAYGSNMNPQRMTDRGVAFESMEYANLMHYRLRSNKVSQKFKGYAFANIEPCFESSVFGVLYKLDPNADLTQLDRKEGYPIHYEKVLVPVYAHDGLRLAMTYIATRAWSNESDLPMSPEYRHMINEGLEHCEDLIAPLNDGQLYEMFLHYKDNVQVKTKI